MVRFGSAFPPRRRSFPSARVHRAWGSRCRTAATTRARTASCTWRAAARRAAPPMASCASARSTPALARARSCSRASTWDRYCDGARRDPSATRLAGLLRRLLDATADLHAPGAFPVRFRISSIEPRDVDDALVDLLAAADGRVCRHLHLPLQAGSSKVLREMARPYDADRFRALVERLYGRRARARAVHRRHRRVPRRDRRRVPGDARAGARPPLREDARLPVLAPRGHARGRAAPTRCPPISRPARAAALRALGDELRAAERARRAGTVELALVEEGGVAMSESYFRACRFRRRRPSARSSG